jgi:hypothetical protein
MDTYLPINVHLVGIYACMDHACAGAYVQESDDGDDR